MHAAGMVLDTDELRETRKALHHLVLNPALTYQPLRAGLTLKSATKAFALNDLHLIG